jgi:glucose/arabinose dehydrogenase/mono/diheme cytochrome c family protein
LPRPAILLFVVAGLIAPAGLAKPKPNPKQQSPKVERVDHAGIIRSLSDSDYKIGKTVYSGLCVNCHGSDGKTAPLPTARAFGSQLLKFGGDHYAIYQTLTKGNGLMGPMLHLSPRERYGVAHFIRETYLKPANNGYEKPTADYLQSLPKGKWDGVAAAIAKRDFGPGLASQFGQQVTAAMTLDLGPLAVSYSLHSMDALAVWEGDFIDLSNTQHYKLRGEGVPAPQKALVPGLDGWAWGHENTLDYPKDELLPRGPMPAKWLHYHGHYLHGSKMIFSYAIDGRDILQVDHAQGAMKLLTRTLYLGPGPALLLRVSNHKGGRPISSSVAHCRVGPKTGPFTAATLRGNLDGLSWVTEKTDQITVSIPASATARILEVALASGTGKAAFDNVQSFLNQRKNKVKNPRSMLKGGDLRWPEQLTTAGKLGDGKGAYVMDTISHPSENPWNAWLRTSALDFFDDGRMALATHGGDVWIVSGIDDDLGNLRWKRYAAGMYEPFGLRVVDNIVYVTCKDRLVRLHDYNKDGEADFYESFSADDDVSSFFHAFNFDLQTDSKGNFYYAKCGQYTSYRLPGSIIKVSPDGKTRSVYATGFRTPNGIGITSDDRITVSDNQGNWMPASKVSMVRAGGFYGYVQTHAKKMSWAPDGGKIDHRKVVPPKTFDQPMIWMPQDVDNSSGGQLWVEDERWGPLSGRLVHTSFGKGWMYYLLIQDVGDISQAAMITLPQNYETGIMRARVNPKDGQVYSTGLNGWNGRGRKGLTDGAVHRLRYTGKPFRMVDHWRVSSRGIELGFNFKLDTATAANPASYKIDQWNYKWAASYGSKRYRPDTEKEGRQVLTPADIEISKDGKRVLLNLVGLSPVNQMRIVVTLKDDKGQLFKEEVLTTINSVPAR